MLRTFNSQGIRTLSSSLTGSILKHESKGALFLKKSNIKSKKGKIRAKRTKTDKNIQKIEQFSTLYEKNTHLGAVITYKKDLG